METTYARPGILRAANRLVQREGVARLTIDAVAREAGLSKGGVLYHFPSKDALIAAMIGVQLDEFEQEIARQVSADPLPQGRLVRAYIRASCDPPEVPLEQYGGLAAALANNLDLLEPLRQRYANWQDAVERDGVPPASATLARLAADGLWFAELLGLAPPTGALREEVVRAMLDLGRPPGGG